MESTATDFEELAARLTTRTGSGSAAGARAGAQSVFRASGANGSRGNGARAPVSSATAPPAAAPRNSRGESGRTTAMALALTCREVQAIAASDPKVPGPSLASVARVLSTALEFAPTPDGGPSAAAVCNGRITGRKPHGGREELARHIVRAASSARARSTSSGYSHEQFIQALIPLLPMLAQALPAILPVIMPLIQQLLGGLTKAKSLSGPAPAGADAATLQQLLTAAAAAGAAGGAPAAAGGGAAPAGGPVAPVPPTPPVPPDPAAPAAGAPATADAAAAIAALQGAGGGQGAAALSPEQISSLIGALGGAGGTGGIVGLLGGPGHELVKSVVDRLPIEKMFDGQAWIPKSNYDEWRSTMPWEAVLSLSEPSSVVGGLFVPGRAKLKPLAGVKLDLVERTMTRVPGGGESWIFVADRTARLRVEVLAGKSGLSRPFVDVRLSRDGTPGGGLWRSAFRLTSIGPGERRVATIEIPPEVLATAPQDGAQTCASIRVVEQAGDDYAATELRCCFHVVAPSSLALDGRTGLSAAPELEGLRALEREIPRGALSPDVQPIDWNIELAGRSEISGLARYGPVSERTRDGTGVAEGGLALSPVGVADLARRRSGADLAAEDAAALTGALDSSATLRRRLSIRLREEVPPSLRGADKGVAVRVEMGWVGALLVTFGGIGPDGNPSRRDVRAVGLPVPHGIALGAA